MSTAIALDSLSTIAILIQLLIFVYLYTSHRGRFFCYLIWAWGFIALFKAFSVASEALPHGGVLFPFIISLGSAADLLILAAGAAYRWDYQIRLSHAVLGVAYSALALLTVSAHPIDALVTRPTFGTLISGLLIAASGLAFWPPRTVPTYHHGARFLATSLVLWGLQRVITPFIVPAGTNVYIVSNVSSALLYLLTVFAIVIVVLERARGEMASLKEFNERLVDGLGEGLQLVDGAFTVRHANQWMANQFGPVVEKRCYEAITQDGQQCLGCPLESRNQLPAPVRLDVAGPGGRRFLLTCSPVRQPDGQIFLLELVADVTEQERLRARLSESEQLAAVGELAAGVAHEIRNPLAAIVNATTLLTREESLTPDERTHTLDAVKKEAKRLNVILSDFLSFARPREPKRVRGSVQDVVKHVATLLRKEHAQDGTVHVEVRADPEVPPFAFDPDQLTQVLWNIALNGVEAMGGPGHLILDVGQQNGEALITVSDSGPGIPAEEGGRIFQPFFSKKRGGTGLGLAIARRIITAHGGRIDLESSPGQGSRFTVRLPLTER